MRSARADGTRARELKDERRRGRLWGSRGREKAPRARPAFFEINRRRLIMRVREEQGIRGPRQGCLPSRVSSPRLKYSGILHLARSLHRGSPSTQVPIMATATAYFDESHNSGVYAVAGFAATVDRWRLFDSDWSRLLANYRLTSFHAKDYAHSENEFAGWKGDEAKRKTFMERLIAIVARRCMVAIGVVIDRSAFQNMIAQDKSIAEFYSNEYAMAALMSLLLTRRWAGGCAFTDPVDYVFDRGNPQRSGFQRAYDLALRIPGERSRLGALSFADDKQIPALQAADLIVYESCKMYTDLSGGTRRFRASMKALLSKMRCDIKAFSKQDMIKLAEKMRSIPD